MRGTTGIDPREELLTRVREALADGRIGPDDLTGLLREARPERGPRPTRVAEALGAVVVLVGAALAYATAFGDMPDAAQLLTPFAFPVVILGAFALMAAGSRARWELEVTATLGVAALVAALMAAWAGTGGMAIDRWGLGASVVVGAVCALLAARPPHAYAAALGLAGAPVAAANFGASVLGMSDAGSYRWLEFGLAGLAAAAGVALLRPRRTWAGIAFGGASLLTAAGAVLGLVAMNTDIRGLTPWHVVLSVTVAASVVLASALRMPALMAAGVATGAVWLVFVIPVAGSSPGWALLVVAMGLVLVAAGLGGARLHGGPRRHLGLR